MIKGSIHTGAPFLYAFFVGSVCLFRSAGQELLIEGYRAKVPLLGGFLLQPFVHFGMIDILHGLHNALAAVLGKHLRHMADLRRQNQIEIVLRNVQVHSVTSFASIKVSVWMALSVWNRYWSTSL